MVKLKKIEAFPVMSKMEPVEILYNASTCFSGRGWWSADRVGSRPFKGCRDATIISNSLSILSRRSFTAPLRERKGLPAAGVVASLA